MQGDKSQDSQNRSRIYTIVGLGESARNWQAIGHSIGVNDVWKFGKPTDSLLVCNHPGRFSKERFEIIKNSKPKTFYSHKNTWKEYFPDNYVRVPEVTWYGVLNPGQVYSSDTSPFIAISLAYNLGASKIILWGCDFKNHHIYNPGNPQTKKEIERYMQLIGALKEKSVEVFRGADGGAFDELLPLYRSEFIELKVDDPVTPVTFID